MAYGENIKFILKQKGMSIKELSGKSGVSINTLYSITKNDPLVIRQSTLDRILPVLELSAKELANYDMVRLDLEDGTTMDDTRKIMIDQVSRIMKEVDNQRCVKIFEFAVQEQVVDEYNFR